MKTCTVSRRWSRSRCAGSTARHWGWCTAKTQRFRTGTAATSTASERRPCSKHAHRHAPPTVRTNTSEPPPFCPSFGTSTCCPFRASVCDTFMAVEYAPLMPAVLFSCCVDACSMAWWLQCQRDDTSNVPMDIPGATYHLPCLPGLAEADGVGRLQARRTSKPPCVFVDSTAQLRRGVKRTRVGATHLAATAPRITVRHQQAVAPAVLLTRLAVVEHSHRHGVCVGSTAAGGQRTVAARSSVAQR